MNAGVQIGKTVRLWFDYSAAKKTPFLGIKWDVGGEVIDSYTYLTDASMKMARKVIKVLGMDIDDSSSDLNDLTVNPIYIGKEAELDIQEEEYNDQTQLKVKWINPVRASTPEDLDLNSIASKLRAAGSEKSKAKAAAKTSKAAPPKADDPDEDIPF